ncbi:uncharacterized protein yc1106_04955 [Curvularia clavata]|uniref:Glucose/galactose transporter n=1 Tax=Curvularia clavata TaxID=95742 RepID=A0A9Q8Z794_CURCL|nr:uncharacterized protein yc1106_04955 [Curvularia clavata]
MGFFNKGGSQEQAREQQERHGSTVEVDGVQVRSGAAALTARQSILPVTLVTTLFFCWGFAYGLLDVLNSRFQVALDISKGQSSGLQAAYFGAYFIGPLTYSGWFVRKFGYRWTFILGLSIYCVGALMFWPSAVYRSFPGFCASLFIAGSGLSTLEVSANPYIAVCGPPKYSEIRLELSQSIQAVGSVVAPVLASKVIFANVGSDGKSLHAVQFVYLGIACFVAALALVFFFCGKYIPEITDSDMAEQELSTASNGYVDKPLRKQYTLFWGTFAQFSYVGAQVGCAAYFINYFTDANPQLSVNEGHRQGANFYAIAQALFAIGRFAAAGIMYLGLKPRWVLLTFQTAIIIFISAAIGVDTGNANTPNWGGISMLMIVLFFESCIFPIIFALTLRGLGRHTKRGASFLVASVCGGAVVPAILGNVADKIGTRKAMCVPLAFFFIAWSYPIYLNLVKGRELDAYTESHVGTEQAGADSDSVLAEKDVAARTFETTKV